MSFRKTGECPITKVFCRCGQELSGTVAPCPKCGKKITGKSKKKSEKSSKDDSNES